MKMSKKGSITGRRAWNILRLALLWARKGGLFRNRMVINLNVLQKGIRKLRHPHHSPHVGALVYGDRQFSFDDTPIIHVKMHRPSSLRFKLPQIPCIKPQVDFDLDDDIYGVYGEIFDRIDCAAEEEEKEEEEEEEDEGIDSKAEEFIAKFYQQMKLQRQISYLQYNEKNSS